MKKVLFVCTGNTCRSPMAQAVFNDACQTKGFKFEAFSCGLYADDVSSVSENAKAALKSKGIDLEHVSTQISQDILHKAEYIFGITENHAREIIKQFPEFADKVYKFPLNISDPYGADLNTYIQCLEQIQLGINIIIESLSECKNEEL